MMTTISKEAAVRVSVAVGRASEAAERASEPDVRGSEVTGSQT